MKPVKSSSIEAVDHDPAKRTLTVKFRDGDTYRYDGVAADRHATLMGADSIGKHFHKHILGKFKATKI